MGTARNNQVELKLPLLEKPKTLKNYSQPEVLRHTFETLSNLHKLLPNHLMELLHSCKSEEDKKKCFAGVEVWSGLPLLDPSGRSLRERSETEQACGIPAGHRIPAKSGGSSLPQHGRDPGYNLEWQSPASNPSPPDPCFFTWLKKNMRPTEDLASVTQRLSAFGPIESVTLCGRQSAVVVFRDMVSACNVVNAFQSRAPGSMFQCSWQQPFMSRELRLPPTKSQRKLPRRV
ncbi:uncharacterized protein C6orf201 homolog [Cervus canadensis]|uniref:uncharacterized protein C6orf201 homolog n=1 Tax=Cervus canadensis TaxID=1574408 RepID=UPI001CA35A42|nr:uncharacterized protein C6orf201 homolog [Cervus canadensis]